MENAADFQLPIGQWRSSAFPDAITDGVFFEVEADFGFGWSRGWFQERAELLEDFPQSHIVDE